MESAIVHLREIVVFLVAAGLIVPFAHRWRISPVLGFLVIGFIIGPHGAGRLAAEHPWIGYAVIDNREGVHLLAEFGVMLLLFVIGLELSVARLWSMRRLVFGLGGAQVLVTSVVIGAIAFAYGNTAQASLVFGACLALSSTAMVMQLLTENRRLGSAAGRTSFAVLLLQDLAVVPILFLVGVLGVRAEGSLAGAFAEAVGLALLAIAAIMGLGNLVVRPLFRAVGATGSRELFMATVLLTVIATALATAAAGLSMALGAFLAGLLLADTEYRHQIEVDIEPFKGLLLGVFFLSVGMSIDPLVVAAAPAMLLASVIGLFVIKGLILFVLARLFRIPTPIAAETALLLGQAGEFAFVILGMALTLGVADAPAAQFMLIVAGLSMAVTPLMARRARQLSAHLEDRATTVSPHDRGLPAADGGLSGHVVIAGYGRVGEMLGSLLDGQSVPHVAIEADAAQVARYREDGAAVYFGDASRTEMLDRVGLSRAVAFVVTMDSAAAAERIVTAVRAARPDLPIFARARDTQHARRLLAAGATRAVPETVEASLQLGEALLAGAGLPEDAAHAVVELRRSEERERLQRSDSGPSSRH